MTVAELMAKRSAAIAAQKAIVDPIVKAGRAPTPEEREKINAKKTEIDGLTESINLAAESERVHAIDTAVRGAAGRGDTLDDVDDKTIRRYSLLRAIRLRLDGKTVDGVEGELSSEIANRSGKPAKGFYIPTRVLAEGARAQRALVTTTTGAGALKTAVSSDYIDLLRAATVSGRLGVRYLNDLVGQFSIPKQTAGSTGYWVDGSSGTITIGAPTVGQVVFTPKFVGAFTDLSRNFLAQSSVDAENWARDDLFKNLAVSVDTALVDGTGANGQPLGIRRNTSCNSVILSNGTAFGVGTGGNMTWTKAVQMATLVEAANVMVDSGAYLFTPSGKGALKTTAKQSGYPEYLVEDDIMNGYPVVGSNVLPIANGTNNTSSAGIFGNWSDAVIGMWGGVDILIDPFTLGNSGGVRVVGMQDVDIELRQAASFTNVWDLAY